MSKTEQASSGLLALRSRRGRWVLAATILSSGAIGIDASVVNIALPAIGREFSSPFASLQWVVLSYTLTLAALILLGGTLGDQFGRRRIFVIGILWFGAASVLCAVSPTITWLICARALQGIGGALATPAALAIIESSFVRSDRPRAIGYWAGLSGATSAIAPFIGGWLIEMVSWRGIFVINVPIVIAVALLAWRSVGATTHTAARTPIDFLGAALTVIGLGSVTFAILQTANHGLFEPDVWVPAVAGVAALILIVVVERRSHHPMLPLQIFRSIAFSTTTLATFFDYAAIGVFFVLLPVYLETVEHLSPLAAGAALLPATALTLFLSGPSGALAQRIGARSQMTFGPLIAAVGIVLTVGGSGQFGFVWVIVGVCVFGLGLATLVSPLTATALGSAPDELAGLASGINNAVARTGSLIAVAAVPVFSGLAGDSYIHAHQFAHGYVIAALMCGALLAAGGVSAALGVPGLASTARSSVPQQ